MKTNQIYFRTWNGSVIEAPRQQTFEEIPEAWIPIVNKLIDDLFEAGWDGQIDQIKEKFGSLRFYIPEGNAVIDELIDMAESETARICIVCGEPATATTKGWYTHVCDKHREKK